MAKGRFKTRDQEDEEDVSYNFLTKRYVQVVSTFKFPEKYLLDDRTNIILDLRKVQELGLDKEGYLSIFLLESYPHNRITDTSHEKYLNVLWDDKANRYFTLNKLTPLQEPTAKHFKEVWFEPIERYIPELTEDQQVRIGVRYSKTSRAYIYYEKEYTDKFSEENKKLLPTVPVTDYYIPALAGNLPDLPAFVANLVETYITQKEEGRDFQLLRERSKVYVKDKTNNRKAEIRARLDQVSGDIARIKQQVVEVDPANKEGLAQAKRALAGAQAHLAADQAKLDKLVFHGGFGDSEDEMAEEATFSNKITLKDLPIYTGTEGENPVQFKELFHNLLTFFGIDISEDSTTLVESLAKSTQTFPIMPKSKTIEMVSENPNDSPSNYQSF